MNPRNPLAVLRALEKVIAQNPQLRIGQAIDNARFLYNESVGVFNIEDDDLAKALERFSVTRSVWK